MDRIARLLSTSDRSSQILEIGPSHAPIAPKSAGWNSFVVDHSSQEELRQKYAGLDLDLDAIEPVDAVWQSGPLHDAIPPEQHGRFDTLIASHVIEHIPDIAGFLVSASRLLNPNGTVVLAIPDRRYCFDYFKPHTTTGDVLQAHAGQRTHHARRTVWDHMAYSVTLDGITAWGQHPVGEARFISPFAHAADMQAMFSDDNTGPYLDCHAWHFTPVGFALVVLELGQLGVIDWRIDALHGPEGCEFYAVLRRGAERIEDPGTLQERRMLLLRQQLREMREQIDFALGSLIAGEADPHSSRIAQAWARLALRPVHKVWRMLHRTYRPRDVVGPTGR